MSQSAVETFLGRIVTDHKFRCLAESSLEYACNREGFVLSAEELRSLSTLRFAEFARLAESVDGALRRS